MESPKISNLLNEENNTTFVARKWNTVNDQSNANYAVRNKIIYSTEVLKSNLFSFNDAYIRVRSDITILGNNVT